MKLKNMAITLSAVFLVLLCIGCVSASQDSDTFAAENDDIPLMESAIDEINDNATEPDENGASEDTAENSTDVQENSTQANSSENTTNATPSTSQTKKVKKISLEAISGDSFIKKSNKYFTVSVGKYNEKKNGWDFYKNVKLTVKVKIGSKIKTYHVKTNSKGIAKVFNVKKLKVGNYKVTVTSNDARYKIKEKGILTIFNKKAKTVTLKMNKHKKVKGDYIETMYFTKNGQNSKGVHVHSYNVKNPLDGISHTFVTKAKIFFKNKKTGKIITKTVKSKHDPHWGWNNPYHKLIKGYKPIKAKIWYVTT